MKTPTCSKQNCITIFITLLLPIWVLSCGKDAFNDKKVNGRVLARDNNKPVASATVYLRKYDEPPIERPNYYKIDVSSNGASRAWSTDSVLTDAAGYFEFDQVDPIVVWTKKDNYYQGSNVQFNDGMSSENAELFLSPYAWIRIVAFNQSGAYKILTHGIDEKPYELIVPQFETREVIVPEYGEGESFIYIFKLGANNETIPGLLYEKINVQYRDTSVLKITF